ncbi:unnamed protein product [marine sediment metagenome]|uniref:Uncharacterized protein n=1 Tax=marine sediment metagenome TaxID=412755 RepID=X1T9D6_9ZZZZ
MKGDKRNKVDTLGPKGMGFGRMFFSRHATGGHMRANEADGDLIKRISGWLKVRNYCIRALINPVSNF